MLNRKQVLLAALLMAICELNFSAASFPFVGQTYIVKFPGGDVYKNEFLSDTDFRFTGISGEETGRTEVVKYTTTQVSPYIYKIEWVESDNTVVVHIDDFENMKAYVSITTPNLEFLNWEGTLTQFTDDSSAQTSPVSTKRLSNYLKRSDSYPFVGKTYKVIFDQGASYMNEFLSNDEFRYTGLAGDDKGKTELVKFTAIPIARGIFKIFWQEADKTTVVHIDDFIRGNAFVSVTTPDLVLMTWKGTLEPQ